MSENAISQMGGEPPAKSSDLLVVLLYGVLRDHVHPGDLEQAVLEIEDADKEFELSNRYLAGYAENIAARLRGQAPGTQTDE